MKSMSRAFLEKDFKFVSLDLINNKSALLQVMVSWYIDQNKWRIDIVSQGENSYCN